MHIKLHLKGENREFTAGYINMLTVRRGMEIQQKIADGKMDLSRPTPTQLDTIVDFIVVAFDNQFTREELYQGLPARGFVRRLIDIINEILDILLTTHDELPE